MNWAIGGAASETGLGVPASNAGAKCAAHPVGRRRVERGSAMQFGHEVFVLNVLLGAGLDRCGILGG
jgi:hypothetical protein